MCIRDRYIGDDTRLRVIDLGFTPRAVLSMTDDGVLYYAPGSYGGLSVPGGDSQATAIVENGFTVDSSFSLDNDANNDGTKYHYIAFR